MPDSAMYLRSEYRIPDYCIPETTLDVRVDTDTVVDATLVIERNASADRDAELVLDARGLILDAIAIDGEPVAAGRITHDETHLRIRDLPERCTLTTRTRLQPETNTALEGFYASGPMFCTQCEAHGFSRITPFIDRPDVLSRFRVRLEADRKRFPVLLANGDCVDSGTLEDDRHFAEWVDPFPKPAYLFAMVAGDLACVRDSTTTAEGREVTLAFYVDHGNEHLVDHAMASLKQAMRWDEDSFGLSYDLDTYMVVAARAFNMGAMENKGLNIFNSSLVLASTETTTDETFDAIAAVIAHEYFHNYTGNRVTCRDWFQLSLKEGLTVYRDQRFSEDTLGGDAQRIEQVRALRAVQFPEDAGPTAHPVRPEAYREVNNFYTATVYEKGAEIVRMLHTRIGEDAFRQGLRRYLTEFDGTAATIEDFVSSLTQASGVDLTPFLQWYGQAGTPRVTLSRVWDAEARRVTLRLEQATPSTPGQTVKQPLPIPFRLRLIDSDGAPVPLPEHPARLSEDLLLFDTESLEISMPSTGPLLPSCLQQFSAPVRLQADYTAVELQRIAVHESDAFVRWDAIQSLHARAHAGLMDDDRGGLEALLVALQHIAAKPPEDAALAAQLFAPPRPAWLWDQYEQVDPQRLSQCLHAMEYAIAHALCGPLSVWAQRQPLKAGQTGERALTNVALGYLALLEAPSVLTMARKRADGDNMTLTMGALRALNRTSDSACAMAMAAFHTRWEEDPLVLDRWFALRAGNPHVDAESIRELLAHPRFDWTNPNRVRAVLGAFSRENLTQFHTEDGYRLYADALARLDASNPQIAARLSQPMLGFARLASPWRGMQHSAVADLRARVSSANLTEMLDGALAG